jgi:hypothetical protein
LSGEKLPTTTWQNQSPTTNNQTKQGKHPYDCPADAALDVSWHHTANDLSVKGGAWARFLLRPTFRGAVEVRACACTAPMQSACSACMPALSFAHHASRKHQHNNPMEKIGRAPRRRRERHPRAAFAP